MDRSDQSTRSLEEFRRIRAEQNEEFERSLDADMKN